MGKVIVLVSSFVHLHTGSREWIYAYIYCVYECGERAEGTCVREREQRAESREDCVCVCV